MYHEGKAENGEHTGAEQKAAGGQGTQISDGAGKRLQGQRGAREGGPQESRVLCGHFSGSTGSSVL